MNPNLPILPDSMGNIFIILGIIVIAVYIKAAIEDIKAAQHESRVHKFKSAVKANKESHKLADYYLAAAYGDYEDFDYWEETARKFM